MLVRGEWVERVSERQWERERESKRERVIEREAAFG